MINAIVGQSGGPTAAINASLAGVISSSLQCDKIHNLYGMINGIEGVLKEHFLTLDNSMDLGILSATPSAFLGSCRYKLPDENSDNYVEIFDKIVNVLIKNNIKYFFYIGGNDSMDTVNKLHNYVKKQNLDIKIVGIPKTIDNDLAVTDHTPGFGSSAKYIATTVMETSLDCMCYDIDCFTIIEIMGRNTGWLAASSALSRTKPTDPPHIILLPEKIFDYDEFYKEIDALRRTTKNIVIAVSEGIKTGDGKFVCEGDDHVLDAYGHKQLSGTGEVLARKLKEKYHCKTRAVELNLPQRAAGHLQSKTDIDESFSLGENAVLSAINGKSGIMMCLKRISNNPYKIVIESNKINEIANIEKTIPTEFLCENKSDVTEAFIQYASPLIQGEISIKYENGVPKFLRR